MQSFSDELMILIRPGETFIPMPLRPGAAGFIDTASNAGG
jgi:hypothetical protein